MQFLPEKQILLKNLINIARGCDNWKEFSNFALRMWQPGPLRLPKPEKLVLKYKKDINIQ